MSFARSSLIASRVSLSQVALLRASFLETLNCQFVRASILPRGLADVYAFWSGDEMVAYGGVWNHHFPGRVMEFHLHPESAAPAGDAFASLLEASGATHVEAQTNMPAMYRLAERFCPRLETENWLFEAKAPTRWVDADLVFRRRQNGDEGPDGEWVVAKGDRIVAAGGLLTHYNPPYADIHVAVVESERNQGVGRFLVQELNRVCLESGLQPSARCDAANEASRRTLERGGMKVCGRIVAGAVDARRG